ncbi:band 4.1-like protein 2 isoform X14 [Protopterus annectens]|uniref:band 4.1-like protein 2 isoform X14 n=1 Tax=Protopterus annectens TaxID=7888 RepID=UPI001CF938F3|nr:band 4.1-like protein 2 isoform X14 [Protopterus annectens]
MTTEGDTGVEVQKETEKSDEQPASPSHQQSPQSTSSSLENREERADSSGDQHQDTEAQSPPQGGGSPAGTPPSSKSSPSSDKKERNPSGGKGISRFLPSWRKKQRSQSQTSEEDAGKEEPAPVKEEETTADKDQNVKLEEEVVKSEEPKEEVDKQEKHSVSGSEAQPAREDGKEEKSDEKATDIKEDKVDSDEKIEPEEAKRETKEVQTVHTRMEKSPKKTPKKVKTVPCRVVLLDGTEYPCEIEKRSKGQVLFDKVCAHLNLLEKDYFGLTYRDSTDQKNWLDLIKDIKKQIRNYPWQFAFNVKFYPPDPSQLTEDITRYLLCLQLRQDIASGRLPCSFVTHALLGSYTLQAELGDYSADDQRLESISEFQFAPNQTKELEDKIMELHKTHRGLTPAMADSQFLENAKKLSMYGVDLHHAKDSEAVDIMLGVCANGLLIYKDRLRINRFAWPKILKISYKRSNFYIKIRPGETEHFESTIGFKLPSHRAAKRLWKVCVEHHTFFRLLSPEQPPKAKFLTLGSKFRYSGRTQAQTRQASTLIDRPAPYFERTSSKRISRSLDGPNTLPYAKKLDADLPEEFRPSEVTEWDGIKEMLRTLTIAPELSAADEDLIRDSTFDQPVSVNEVKPSASEPVLRDEKRSEELLSQPPELELHKETKVLEEQGDVVTAAAAESNTAETKEEEHSRQEKNIADQAEETTTGSADNIVKISDENQKPEVKKKAEDLPLETVVNVETEGMPKLIPGGEKEVKQLAPQGEVCGRKDSTSSSDSSNESEGEEGGEYHTQTKLAENTIKEEEENEDMTQNEEPGKSPRTDTIQGTRAILVNSENVLNKELVFQNEVQEKMEDLMDKQVKKTEQHQKEEHPQVNGVMLHHETDDSIHIIQYTEPPVVKTEMVTISDASQKNEIATKEVPILHTETKTITYEAAETDGGGDNEPAMLLSAQTITSESISTTTTTHITKTVKGGISETRIEKRIVITGDADIDHDEALAQAIKEAKEQHPDMSVTRVVVHKETELTEEGED